MKLKDALANEVGCLRGDLHLVREDRDRQLSLVQDLTAEVLQYKECTGKSAAELGNLTSRSIELEVIRLPLISFMYLEVAMAGQTGWVISQMGFGLNKLTFVLAKMGHSRVYSLSNFFKRHDLEGLMH